MELPALLALLKSNGVLKYKDKELEIEISASAIDIPASPEPPTPVGMPPELKNPDLMSADQIMNWSASPDPGAAEQVPMTGDAPLDPGIG